MFKWLINNVRRGFATNSSSSHSMVHYKTPVASDSLAYGDSEFGWDEFHLNSLGEKLMYALVAHISGSGIGSGWWRDTSHSDVEEAVKKFGHLFPEFGPDAFEAALNGYIDHQSMPDPEEALEAARDPHTIIVGGNDNGGTGVWELIDRHRGNDNVDWIAPTDAPEHKSDPNDPKYKENNPWW